MKTLRLMILFALMLAVLALSACNASKSSTPPPVPTVRPAAPQQAAPPAADPVQATVPQGPAQSSLTEKGGNGAAQTVDQTGTNCTAKPATREGFVACHEARLLQLERDYIKRDPTSKVPTDESVIAWMKAAGLSGQFFQQDARQVHEKQIIVDGDPVTVIEAVQLTCRACTVNWPAVWTTDRPVDTSGGARFIKPTRDNPSVVYTNVKMPFTGTMTFYGDGQDYGTLWPQ